MEVDLQAVVVTVTGVFVKLNGAVAGIRKSEVVRRGSAQCVERGQLKLDEDVTTILPELKGIQILKGFEKGSDGADKPTLVPNTKTITLR